MERKWFERDAYMCVRTCVLSTSLLSICGYIEDSLSDRELHFLSSFHSFCPDNL